MSVQAKLKPILIWTALALLALVLLVPLGAFLLLTNSSQARLWAVDQGLAFAQSETLTISADDIRWPRLGELSIAELSIRINNEEMLGVKKFRLRWQPFALAQKRIHLDELSAAYLKFRQVDTGVASEDETPETKGDFQWPSFWRVDVKKLAFERIELSLPLGDQPLPDYQLEASAVLFADVAPLQLDLDLRSLPPAEQRDLQPTRLTIDTEVSARSQVRMQGSLFEPPGGMIGALMRLPHEQPLDTRFAVEFQHLEDHWQLGITRLELLYLAHQIRLRGGMQLWPEAKKLDVRELYLTVDEHTQKFRGTVSAEQAWFDLELNQLPLDLGNLWSPEPLAGALSGTAEGHWEFAQQRLPDAVFNLIADARLREKDTSIQLSGKSNAELIEIDAFELAQMDTRFTASGTLAPFTEHTDLRASFRNFDSALVKPWVAAWPDYLGFSAKRGELTLKGALTEPIVKLDTNALVTVNNEAYTLTADGTFTLHNAELRTLVIAREQHRIDVSGQVDWQAQTLNLRADLRALTNELIESLDVVDAVELPAGLTFDISGNAAATGSWTSPAATANLQAQGQYSVETGTIPYRLILNGAGRGESLTRYQVTLEEVDLAVNNASVLSARGAVSRDSADLTLDINRLPIDLLSALGINGISGEAHGRLHLQGTPEQPRLNGQLSYSNSEQKFDIDTEIHTEAQTLSLRFGFARASSKVGDFTLRIPLQTYLQPEALQGGDSPLQIAGEGELDLALAQLFLNPELQQIAGNLTIDLEAGGTVASPQLTGFIRSDNIRYQNHLTNTDLEKISVDLVGSREVLTLRSIKAHDQQGGTTELTGTVQLAPSYRESGDMVQLKLRAQNAALAATEMANGKIDANLELHGNLKEMWLSGSGKLQPLNINIDQAFSSSIPSIQYTDVTEASTTQDNVPLIHLKLQLDVENQAFIRGRGLITEIAGGIAITGTQKNLSYQGQFSTKRGQLDLFNKRFVLQEGNVRVSNEIVSLRIVTVHDAGDIEYTVTLAGTIEEPELLLSSNPTLPEDEILARLIFGKSVRDISAFEAIQLGLAAQQLAQGGALGYADSARKMLGVDRLSIDSEETEDGESGFSVGVGKYVSENVYVEIKHTPDPAQPWRGRVEIELSPNLSVQTSTTETGGGRADLLWKMDY